MAGIRVRVRVRGWVQANCKHFAISCEGFENPWVLLLLKRGPRAVATDPEG